MGNSKAEKVKKKTRLRYCEVTIAVKSSRSTAQESTVTKLEYCEVVNGKSHVQIRKLHSPEAQMT